MDIPHSILEGLAAKWFNVSLDYATEHNKWPVRFRDGDENKTDLVPEFVVVVWLRYVSQMRLHPMPTTNAAQLVLKYLLMNDSLVVKAILAQPHLLFFEWYLVR